MHCNLAPAPVHLVHVRSGTLHNIIIAVFFWEFATHCHCNLPDGNRVTCLSTETGSGKAGELQLAFFSPPLATETKFSKVQCLIIQACYLHWVAWTTIFIRVDMPKDKNISFVMIYRLWAQKQRQKLVFFYIYLAIWNVRKLTLSSVILCSTNISRISASLLNTFSSLWSSWCFWFIYFYF